MVQRGIESGTYEVAGTKSYEVKKNGREYTCTCPDAEFNKQQMCKHAHAVEAHVRVADRRDLLNRDLQRFEGILNNPGRARGFSMQFIERKAREARKEILQIGGEVAA